MTANQRQIAMSDPVAMAKAKIVRDLESAIYSDSIDGNASAAIAAAGGSKSWSKMSVAERLKVANRARKDLNDYLRDRFGISTLHRPEIAHVRTVRGR